MDVYERLKELGIELPPAPPPGGLYAPVKLFGANLVYTSGVGPTDVDGKPLFVGKVGAELSVEEGQAAAWASRRRGCGPARPAPGLWTAGCSTAA